MSTRRMIAFGTTVAVFGGLAAVAISTQPGPPAHATPVAAVQAPTTTVRTEVVHRTVHVPSGTTVQPAATAAAVPATTSAVLPTSTARRVSDDRGDNDQGGDRGRDDESGREHDDD